MKKKKSVQQENYRAETATDKKRNLAISDSQQSLHSALKPAESYEVIRIESISPGRRLIDSLKSQKDMVMLKEIFDKPLSMRDPRNGGL